MFTAMENTAVVDWVEKIEIPSCDNASFSTSGYKVLADFGGGSFKIWDCGSGNLNKPQILEHPGIYPTAEAQKNLFVVPVYDARLDRAVTRVWSRFSGGS